MCFKFFEHTSLPFLGYVCLSGYYFGAKLDFQQRKCHILQKITCPVKLNEKEAYKLNQMPWMMVHKKTNTIYQITNSNNSVLRRSRRLQSEIQLEWKAIRKFSVRNSHDLILSFTRDYLLTSKGDSFEYEIQCIRSGRIVDITEIVWGVDCDLAIVSELFNYKIKKLFFRFNAIMI